MALGVDTYLKMLLQDNFVHTDLHPGNILVRARVPRGGFGGAAGGGKTPGGNLGAGGEASVTLPEALAAAAASADPARGAAEVAERLQLVRVTLPGFGTCGRTARSSSQLVRALSKSGRDVSGYNQGGDFAEMGCALGEPTAAKEARRRDLPALPRRCYWTLGWRRS